MINFLFEEIKPNANGEKIFQALCPQLERLGYKITRKGEGKYVAVFKDQVLYIDTSKYNPETGFEVKIGKRGMYKLLSVVGTAAFLLVIARRMMTAGIEANPVTMVSLLGGAYHRFVNSKSSFGKDNANWMNKAQMELNGLTYSPNHMTAGA